MAHLEGLRAHKVVFLRLELAPRTDGKLNVLREREVQREIMVAHYRPIAIAVVIHLYIEKQIVRGIVNLHHSADWSVKVNKISTTRFLLRIVNTFHFLPLPAHLVKLGLEGGELLPYDLYETHKIPPFDYSTTET